MLAGAVLAAVHHAEVVAHRVGEPFGSLVLAVAVTVIEVALIVTLMVSGGDGDRVAGPRHRVRRGDDHLQRHRRAVAAARRAARTASSLFNAEGTGGGAGHRRDAGHAQPGAADVHRRAAAGPEFSPAQLAFAAVASLVLYGAFVLDPDRAAPRLLPAGHRTTGDATPTEDEHADAADRPRGADSASGCCCVALVAVVGLAKVESPAIEDGVAAVGFPPSFVGVVIALLVLLPETLAAVRAARRDRVQISLNLALGSAMASIGLTIPAIAVASIWLDGPLLLGLGADADGAARADRRRRRADRGARPGDPAAGRRAPGAVRRVPVPRGQPLRSRAARIRCALSSSRTGSPADHGLRGFSRRGTSLLSHGLAGVAQW